MLNHYLLVTMATHPKIRLHESVETTLVYNISKDGDCRLKLTRDLFVMLFSQSEASVGYHSNNTKNIFF